MEITVTARHLTVNAEIKNYAASAIEAAFAEFRLKISSATLVLDMQRNLVSASLSVAAKDCPVAAASEAFDNPYKAIDDSVAKAATQLRKFLDKRQDHKKEASLKDTEIKKVEQD